GAGQCEESGLKRVFGVRFLWKGPPTNTPNESGVAPEQFGEGIGVGGSDEPAKEFGVRGGLRKAGQPAAARDEAGLSSGRHRAILARETVYPTDCREMERRPGEIRIADGPV